MRAILNAWAKNPQQKKSAFFFLLQVAQIQLVEIKPASSIFCG